MPQLGIEPLHFACDTEPPGPVVIEVTRKPIYCTYQCTGFSPNTVIPLSKYLIPTLFTRARKRAG